MHGGLDFRRQRGRIRFPSLFSIEINEGAGGGQIERIERDSIFKMDDGAGDVSRLRPRGCGVSFVDR